MPSIGVCHKPRSTLINPSSQPLQPRSRAWAVTDGSHCRWTRALTGSGCFVSSGPGSGCPGLPLPGRAPPSPGRSRPARDTVTPPP
eukprot:152199-Rhodomonas_salina.1